jgi:hypothetical protein
VCFEKGKIVANPLIFEGFVVMPLSKKSTSKKACQAGKSKGE